MRRSVFILSLRPEYKSFFLSQQILQGGVVQKGEKSEAKILSEEEEEEEDDNKDEDGDEGSYTFDSKLNRCCWVSFF